MGRITADDKKERDEYIIELIKTNGKDGVTGLDISKDLGISVPTVRRYMQAFRKEHPEIQTRQDHAKGPITYFFVEPHETHSPFLLNRYEKAGKNHEGYSDPTASTAIQKTEEENVKKERDLIMPVAGEVWTAVESNGKTGYIYVLAFEENAAQCIKLYSMSDVNNGECINRDIRIKIGGETYIGDASRVTFKLKKYLLRRTLKRDDTVLPAVRKAVASVFGILSFRNSVEPTVIEKAVVKEVPVEKIVYRDKEPENVPEGYISKKEAELRDYKRQAEIWKAAFYGVVNGNGRVAENL